MPTHEAVVSSLCAEIAQLQAAVRAMVLLFDAGDGCCTQLVEHISGGQAISHEPDCITLCPAVKRALEADEVQEEDEALTKFGLYPEER